MTFSTLFSAYLILVVVAAGAVLMRFVAPRVLLVSLILVAAWLGYASLLGMSGVVGHYDHFPPGLVLLVVPIVVVLIALAVSVPGAILAARIPLSILLGFQTFRVGVELSLHQLWRMGMAPHLVTLEGGNVEILIAVTAPLAAWLVTRGAIERQAAWLWNLAGLISLANVVVRAVLSAPGPLHLINAEVPDMAILTWPFTFVAGFMAPLALMLHILAFRAFSRVNSLNSGTGGSRVQ